MKKLIAGTKGKVVGVTLAGALVFGGGAAVGASYDFGSHLDGVAGNISDKVASFTGKTVDERQKIEANEVSNTKRT
ncbi:hypothetical protein CEH05_07565 [Halobacillus halophilus]|uniref:Uncharacterized protein n=1 Tax=Halobacillus halophilus (strain ATCC 35676 / DSM 2266 / JCM 20832 / KCTC 3685 / LMG 17431 / NBRC 102448 / NCIMB 2269) TaxID=866895 RepID=I0JL31_HALH3|nr:hypothetical protein [Halobacillus halophilus]ASF38944.1 hypothetical protein CEH05_07390 [Halobacillus halophilus]ASF38976.1 hypothetical protein CEH05_07565 [Halobacillus halophilus]CCG44823.1 hypothetical protein HBHAL_2480 [Halobacillus halophilus DSM 2266]CCG44851.1 hypothetical protein HBHAL_2506 [Halobacillus halophilus DSM 2266]